MSALYWISGCLLGYFLAIEPNHVDQARPFLVALSALALVFAAMWDHDAHT